MDSPSWGAVLTGVHKEKTGTKRPAPTKGKRTERGRYKNKSVYWNTPWSHVMERRSSRHPRRAMRSRQCRTVTKYRSKNRTTVHCTQVRSRTVGQSYHDICVDRQQRSRDGRCWTKERKEDHDPTLSWGGREMRKSNSEEDGGVTRGHGNPQGMMGWQPCWRWMRRYRERVLGREAGKRAAVTTVGWGWGHQSSVVAQPRRKSACRNSGDERQARKRL